MTVEVWFFADGFRTCGPPYGKLYRPHFAIKGTQEYLGIQFENLQYAPYGEHMICNVELLFEGVDYSKLIGGTSFEIREGSHVVGEGIVLSTSSQLMR